MNQGNTKQVVIAFLLVLVCLMVHAGGLQAQSLTLGPYLQNVTDMSIVVKFKLDTPSVVEVRYGPTEAYGSSVLAPSATDFEVFLDGLTAGATYHYRLQAGETPLCDDITFRAAPPPRAPFRALILGDTRSDHDSHRAAVTAASSSNSHVWMHTGDMVSDGGVEEQWRTFFEIESSLMQSVPQFGAIGNHDESGGDAANYINYYSLPVNSPVPEFYYSFNYGNLHWIVLDHHVNVDPELLCFLRIMDWSTCFNEAQLAWLGDDLAAASSNPDIDHIFVSLHMGPYSSKDGRTGSGQMRHILPMLADHGVEMIISGHDHYYERGFSENGVGYMISAGGGAGLYEVTDPGPLAPPHTIAYNESIHHYTVVDIDYLCVTFNAYYLDGSLMDHYDYCSDPKVCVDPDFDCGALPPSCAAGRWVCEAGYCVPTDCEGVEPVPDEPAETVEPAADAMVDTGPDIGPEPDAAEDVPITPDATEDAAVEDPAADAADDTGLEEDGQTGCGCTFVR